jgi:predicted transcriptional regulator
VTEIEILRRRRELVLLSAQLQRATVVRRLDNVSRHPAQAVFGLATSVASVPLLFKLGTMLVGRLARRKRDARELARRGRTSFVAKALPYLKFLPVLRMFPVLKFLNR